MDSWRRKIERIGNQNYPAEARSQGIYGSLVLRVAIRRDGSLDSVELIESSGHQVLDNAALRIVRLAAPFAPFTGDLARSEEHTSELQSRPHLVCRLLLEKK